MKLTRLLFVHIPKTGGVSLHSQLEKVFAPSRSIRFGNRESNRRFLHLPGEHLKRFDYITAHQPLKTFRDRGVDHPAIIMFRDPVRRMISLFNFINKSKHVDHREYRFKTFSDFIEWSRRYPVNFDAQCRFVAGTRSGVEFASEVVNARRAIAYLESDHTLPVLLEHHYDDLLATLSRLLGAKLKNVKRNVSRSRRVRLGKDDLERLEPLIHEDRLLYEEIGNRYEEYKRDFLNALR